MPSGVVRLGVCACRAPGTGARAGYILQHIFLRFYINTYMYIHTYVYIYMRSRYIYIYVHTHLHRFIHTHAFIHTRLHPYVLPCMHAYIYIYIHIYIYIYGTPPSTQVLLSCIKTIDIYSVFWLNSCIFCKAILWTKKAKHQKNPKHKKQKQQKTTNQKTKKPILAPTMAEILWFFGFLVFRSRGMLRNNFQMLRNICGAFPKPRKCCATFAETI